MLRTAEKSNFLYFQNVLLLVLYPAPINVWTILCKPFIKNHSLTLLCVQHFKAFHPSIIQNFAILLSICLSLNLYKPSHSIPTQTTPYCHLIQLSTKSYVLGLVLKVISSRIVTCTHAGMPNLCISLIFVYHSLMTSLFLTFP